MDRLHVSAFDNDGDAAAAVSEGSLCGSFRGYPFIPLMTTKYIKCCGATVPAGGNSEKLQALLKKSL